MKVRVKFLAIPPGALKERELEEQVPDGTTVGQLIARLAEQHPALRPYTRFVSALLNRAYVGMQAELHDGDEVVYAPPVGGG